MFKIFDCLADQQSNGHEIPDKLGQESPDKFDFLRKLSSWTIIFLAGWLGFQGPPYLAFAQKAFVKSREAWTAEKTSENVAFTVAARRR